MEDKLLEGLHLGPLGYSLGVVGDGSCEGVAHYDQFVPLFRLICIAISITLDKIIQFELFSDFCVRIEE